MGFTRGSLTLPRMNARRMVLLADGPTGELDTATAAEVFGALQRANGPAARPGA